MKIQTINPATEKVIESYECLDESMSHERITTGDQAFRKWKLTTFTERKKLMLKLAQILKAQKEELAVLMATEMGKPITAGQAEIDKCAWVCEHYAEHAETYLDPRVIQTEMKKAK